MKSASAHKIYQKKLREIFEPFLDKVKVPAIEYRYVVQGRNLQFDLFGCFKENIGTA